VNSSTFDKKDGYHPMYKVSSSLHIGKTPIYVDAC
jgi:hypothetical protein